MTKKILPVTKIEETKKSLPFNGKLVDDKGFAFSFACFDRRHELFNLGGEAGDETVGGKWFLDLLDCLKTVSTMTIPELRTSMFDLHPSDWEHSNVRQSDRFDQLDCWQFRVNKSRGRVIGFIIDGIFYIVWFDPHHNFANSEGYGTANYYSTPLSEYEQLKYEYDLVVQEKIEFGYEIELLYERIKEFEP